MLERHVGGQECNERGLKVEAEGVVVQVDGLEMRKIED